METQEPAPGYHIWGVDNSAYGPVELPMLVNWIKDDRVVADTWIFVERDSGWFKAPEVPELKMFFKPRPTAGAEVAVSSDLDIEITPGSLRRIKALAEMSEDQLLVLLRFLEVIHVRPFTRVLRKGDPSDALYGVLEGELRSCIILHDKECPVATLAPGSIFGEISLFDKGPHTVDVISNQESIVIKLSGAALENIGKEAPDTALGLYSGLIKSIAGRVRTLTRRYEDSVHAAHGGEAIKAA
jgi:hypothetical protein